MNPAKMLDPSSLSLENLQKSREQEEIKKRQRQDLKLERELRTIPDDNERAVFERSLLNQFGTDQMPEYATKHDPYYTETALRRFQIVYFLSLPFTMGGTYAVFKAARASAGQSSRVFDGPTTASMVGIGLILSGAIAYYDYRMWKKESEIPGQNENSILLEDQKMTELRQILAAKTNRRDPDQNSLLKFSFTAAF
jgi:hypothetical protein